MQFEVKPKIGVGAVQLGANRTQAVECMGIEPESFKKSPASVHPTDAFYSSGFQIFYEGASPIVESIELSRDSGFEILMSGIKVLDLPVPEALEKIQETIYQKALDFRSEKTTKVENFDEFKTVLEGKGTINFRVNDIFKGMKFAFDSSSPFVQKRLPH